MGFGKIPVWVYTAKNGYAWQGLDVDGEDRPTVTLLDKALAVAGNTAGAWGAVVRRPVASRHWKEWPSSRLCWVLFRFHPDAGRDLRGRSCNYIAAACIPAGLPPLDFGSIFQSAEMSEVRTEGFDDLWIDLDGEDHLLHEEEGDSGEAQAEPSWAESWTTPVLLRNDALHTLARWCQGGGADRGDFKALIRAGHDGTGTVAAHVTFAVYAQVAKAQLAAAAYERVRGAGGVAEQTALADWKKEMEPVSSLNRALGGLRGLESLLSGWKSSQEQAAAAFNRAEQTARERAEMAKQASVARSDIDRRLKQFRMSVDEKGGKDLNRSKLDELDRAISAARNRFGRSDSWLELEARLGDLRSRVEAIEGHLDTVRTYGEMAKNDARQATALTVQARQAVEQVRALSQGCGGLFAGGALDAIKRQFELGSNLTTAVKSGKKWVADHSSPAQPVQFGPRKPVERGNDDAQEEEPPRRRHPMQWARWAWGIAAALTVLTCMCLWWWGGKENREKKKDAVRLACDRKYDEAVAKLNEIGSSIWRLQFKAWYAPEKLKKSWNLQKEIEIIQKDALVIKERVDRNPAKGQRPDWWDDYENLISASHQMNADGLYLKKIIWFWSAPMSLKDLKKYKDKFEEAKRKLEEWEKVLSDRETADLDRKNRESLKKACGDAEQAKQDHDALKAELVPSRIQENQLPPSYTNYVYQAESRMTNQVVFDDSGQPCHVGVDGENVPLKDEEVINGVETYNNAAQEWKQASLVLASAAYRARYKAASDSRDRFKEKLRHKEKYAQFNRRATNEWQKAKAVESKATSTSWYSKEILFTNEYCAVTGSNERYLYLDATARTNFFIRCSEMETNCNDATAAFMTAYDEIDTQLKQAIDAAKKNAKSAGQDFMELVTANRGYNQKPERAQSKWDHYQSACKEAKTKWDKAESRVQKSKGGQDKHKPLPADLDETAKLYAQAATKWEEARQAFEEYCQEIDALKEEEEEKDTDGEEVTESASTSSEEAELSREVTEENNAPPGKKTVNVTTPKDKGNKEKLPAEKKKKGWKLYKPQTWFR